MGAQQILRTAACYAGLIHAVAVAGPHATRPLPRVTHRERAAVIDLGPADDAMQRRLGAALVAAGFEPVIGDGVEDALAGTSSDRDVAQLAAAIGEAKRAFGELDCKRAITAADAAIGLAAARQAAGLDAPELSRALAYELLC